MHGTSHAGLNPSLHEPCSPVWALANHVVPCDAVDAPNRLPNPHDDASNAQAFCSRTAGYVCILIKIKYLRKRQGSFHLMYKCK